MGIKGAYLSQPDANEDIAAGERKREGPRHARQTGYSIRLSDPDSAPGGMAVILVSDAQMSLQPNPITLHKICTKSADPMSVSHLRFLVFVIFGLFRRKCPVMRGTIVRRLQ